MKIQRGASAIEVVAPQADEATDSSERNLTSKRVASMPDGFPDIRPPRRKSAQACREPDAPREFGAVNIQSEQILGSGGQGVAHRITVRSGETYVAKTALTPAALSGLAHEGNIYEAIGPHPNIPTFFGRATYRGEPCLLLELADGTDMGKVATRLEFARKHLPKDTAHASALMLHLTCQLYAALNHIHEHGYSHNDIKPENVVVSNTGVLKLVDLGLCTKRSAVPDAVAGTLGFIAPEMMVPRHCDMPRYSVEDADAYAAANLVLKLSTGMMISQGFDALVRDQAEGELDWLQAVFHNGMNALSASISGGDPVTGQFAPRIELETREIPQVGRFMKRRASRPCPFEEFKAGVLVPSLNSRPGERPSIAKAATVSAELWDQLPQLERQGAAMLLKKLFGDDIAQGAERGILKQAGMEAMLKYSASAESLDSGVHTLSVDCHP